MCIEKKSSRKVFLGRMSKDTAVSKKNAHMKVIQLKLEPVWDPNPNIETRIFLRGLIVSMLKMSFANEYKENLSSITDYPIQKRRCYMRYYRMTKDEVIINKAFLFYFIFEDSLENVRFCEGFAWDIRQLISPDKYIQMNAQHGFLPIPLSSSRWNFLVQSQQNLVLVSRETGILAYPLLPEEYSLMMSKMQSNPILCTSSTGCKIITSHEMTSLSYICIYMYDKSSTLRFGPPVHKKPLAPEAYFQTPFSKPPTTPEELAEKKEYVKRRLLETFEGMGIDNLTLSPGFSIPSLTNKSLRDNKPEVITPPKDDEQRVVRDANSSIRIGEFSNDFSKDSPTTAFVNAVSITPDHQQNEQQESFLKTPVSFETYKPIGTDSGFKTSLVPSTTAKKQKEDILIPTKTPHKTPDVALVLIKRDGVSVRDFLVGLSEDVIISRLRRMHEEAVVSDITEVILLDILSTSEE